MNLLYLGNYRRRFRKVHKLIKGNTVTELCFGDTLTADYCRKRNIRWTGIDINPGFVSSAKSKGHNAIQADIKLMEKFPAAETCIITGSLYHFYSELESLFRKMLASTERIIISEPVINLSGNKGIIGKLAGASANVAGTTHSFRYTEELLLSRLKELSKKLNFKFEFADRISKDLIIVITK